MTTFFGASSSSPRFEKTEEKEEEFDLEAIALLIDRLKDDDVELRAESNANLLTIARALGPDRTRDELVPFLCASVDDTDEVLGPMAKSLGELGQFVGGGPTPLLEVLESLAAIEESSVRDEAVRSSALIASSLSDSEAEMAYLPFATRLASHDWFTGRMSACGLIAPFLERPGLSETTRRSAAKLFARLCADDTPMVRRVAATELAKFATALTDDDDDDDIVALFRSLADDDQDSVRLQTAPNCVALAAAWRRSPAKQRAVVLPALIAASADRSWRVRWSAAVAVDATLTSLSDATAKRDAVTAFVDLLNDVEVEVRVAAASRVGGVAEALGDPRAAVALVLPSVETLANDTAQQVRASLASSLGGLARALGPEPTKTRVFPVVVSLLRDANSEVRLNVISNLADVHDVAGDKVKDSLVPAVVDLANDSKWRVRAAVIEHVPLVAARLRGLAQRASEDDDDDDDTVLDNGDDEDSSDKKRESMSTVRTVENDDAVLLDERLASACIEWLRDDVAAVRDAAALNLHALARLLGPKWTEDVAVPRVVEVAHHKSYLRRVTALKAARYLCDAVSSRALAQVLLPAVLDLADDRVPNVRFNAAKALPDLAARLRGLPKPKEEKRQRHRRDPGVGDKRERQFLSPSDDDDEDLNLVGDLQGQGLKTTRRPPADASFSHLVESHILPRLDHLLNDDDTDVRAFANDARRLINDTMAP